MWRHNHPSPAGRSLWRSLDPPGRSLWRSLVGLAALVAAFFIAAAPASAGTIISDQCFPRQQLEGSLAGQYGERVVALGVAAGGVFKGMLIERWESPGGTSWTLTAALPGAALICVVAAGTDWKKKRPSLAKPLGLPL